MCNGVGFFQIICKQNASMVYYEKYKKDVVCMTVLTEKVVCVDFEKDKSLRNALNRGIDDMEAGKELPLDEAMKKITELRNICRNARCFQI